MGQHGQRDVPIPALPVAHFVVVQPAFAFSCLKALFDQPALSSHSDQRCKRVFPGGRVTQIVSALWLLFDAAPHQKRPSPTILFRQLQQRPIIEPFALAAETGGKALPCRCGQTPRNCIHPMLHKIRLPQALVGSHSQHIGHLPPLQEPAQLAVVAVNLVGCNPGRRSARIQCPPDHAPCELRLGGKLDSLRNSCLTATLWILSPLLRNVEFAVHQCRALVRAIAEKYADLAVLDASGRATILALDTRRVQALLYKARLIDDEYRLRTVQFFHYITAYPVARLFCIPARSVQKMLELRLGGKLDSLRNSCLTATLWILSPLLRNVEFAVHQCRALVRAIAEKYADLAVLDASGRATILALDTRRVQALLYKARLVDDQNRIWTAQLFQNVIAQLIPRSVCIPTSPVQQMLHAIGSRFLHPLSQLPAILALTAAQQAL